MIDEYILVDIPRLIRTLFDSTSLTCYYLKPPSVLDIPFIVYHSADLGGGSLDYIGSTGWAGDLTVKSISRNIDTSDSNLKQVIQEFKANAALDTVYDISLKIERSIGLPIEFDSIGAIYASCVICECTVFKKG